MIRVKFSVLLCLLACSVFAAGANTDVYNVVPLPSQIEMGSGDPFVLRKGVRIVVVSERADAALMRDARFLAQYVRRQTGLRLPVSRASHTVGGSINIISGLQSEFSQVPADRRSDSYSVHIGSDGILLYGGSPSGVFYGIQMLRQAIGAEGRRLLPEAVVRAHPRFMYRGMHLDCARHFFSADFVKRYIDILAMHGINRFHWHLTDDQGWRFDNQPYGGYFTQRQCREIVEYAAQRYITVIPEIDMPGHMQGALAAYPSLGCTGGPYKVWPKWGVSDEVLCAGNPQTIEFLHGVLDELTAIFPSELIHLGGDECPKIRWEHCPKCQALAARLGLTATAGRTVESQLQTYLLRDAEAFLAQKGRRVIGWNEILEGGLGDSTTIMSWMGEEGGIQAARMGHDAIMTPVGYCYFDYRQSEDASAEPLAFNSMLLLPTVYGYNPIHAALSRREARHIIGCQGNLWTEYITTPDHAEYMLLPRLAALSEVQWVAPERKDYDEFLGRLGHLEQLYDLMGYNHRRTR